MPADALDFIFIKGFKSIASIEWLPLRPINILIGANGSGKSNFIGAFAFLHAIREGRLQHYVAAAGGADRILHFGSKTTQEVAFHLSFATGMYQYRLSLAATADDSLYLSGEGALCGGSSWLSLEPRDRRGEAGISNVKSSAFTVHQLRDRLSGFRVYHLNDTNSSSPLRKTARLHDNEYLRPDGSNLPAFLYLLRERHPEAYALIRHTIQLVAPFFDDFNLGPQRLNPDDIKLEWRHGHSDQYFDVSALSDGTLRFILLATLFLQPKELRPSTILVDEPELGLHPAAIGILAALIRQASTETQVIVSTQSSLLLDHFQPEDVLVAERAGGSTVIRRLEPAQLAVWLDDYSLGQLWEKNELGGRPVRD